MTVNRPTQLIVVPIKSGRAEATRQPSMVMLARRMSMRFERSWMIANQRDTVEASEQPSPNHTNTHPEDEQLSSLPAQNPIKE